jgi:hypothetical protein
MSERSPFVTGLYRLNAQSSRERLQAVRAAVYARIDELTDPDLRAALQRVADSVDRALLDASRSSVERLAAALDESRRTATTEQETSR